MGKRYDAATKSLIEFRPADWLALVRSPPRGVVRLIDADLSTVTAQADKVILVDGSSPSIVHFEFQASRDRTLPLRVLRYNVLLDERHRLPIRSVVVLLRPEADGAELSGLLVREPYLTFHYEVIRIWQWPVEHLLEGGVGLLPLAPLANLGQTHPRAVLQRLDQRLSQELPPDEADTLIATSWVLMGLRYPSDFVADLFQGVRNMKESSTYQAAVLEGINKGLEQGRQLGRELGLELGRELGLRLGLIREAREFVLRLGRKRLGEPDAATLEILNALDDPEQLEEIGERLLDASNWPEAIGNARPAQPPSA